MKHSSRGYALRVLESILIPRNEAAGLLTDKLNADLDSLSCSSYRTDTLSLRHNIWDVCA